MDPPFPAWRAASRRIDCDHGAASATGTLRPPIRARRLRARLRGHAQPHRLARGRQPGPRDPRQSHAPRRGRLRSVHRRRRRHPPPDPARSYRARRSRRAAASSCRRRATTASRSASSRATRRAAGGKRRSSRPPSMHHNQKVIGWRDVPVDPAAIGPVARESMPVIRQLFIGAHVRRRARDLRAHALHDPQARRPARERARRRRLLHRDLLVAHGRLQGPHARPSGSARSTSTSATTRPSASSRSSTRASARTRSPRGSARTRTAASRTTARSTRCRGNQHLDAAREALLDERRLRRAPRRLQAHHPPGRQRLGVARQRRRLPRRRRPHRCRT